MCVFELFLAQGFAILLLKNQKNEQIAKDHMKYFGLRIRNISNY